MDLALIISSFDIELRLRSGITFLFLCSSVIRFFELALLGENIICCKKTQQDGSLVTQNIFLIYP